MATTTFTQVPAITSDAEFRTWIGNIRTALAAIGLVQTTDTGQIDPATVAYPGTNTTAAGYEIWRFADSLQATKPVYIKIEYGRGSFAQSWGLWFTVGSSTNGAGTINSAIASTRRLLTPANAATTGSCTSYISGNTSRFTMSMHQGTGDSAVVDIERSKDSAGADSDEAIISCASCGSGSSFISWVPYSGVLAEKSNASWPILSPWAGTTAVEGANTALFPLIITAIGPMKPVPRGLLFYVTADIATNTTISVPIYGANHDYKTTGRSVTNVSTAPTCAAILWE